VLIAVLAAAGRHLDKNKIMNVLQSTPRTALKTGARHLATGVAPFWRKEVAIWALLQSLAVWMAVATAMLLAGCASFGNNHTDAKAIDATTLAVSTTLGANAKSDAAWPADDWWKQFNDPALNALIDEGLTTGNSITLRSAEARLKAAQAIVRGAQSTLYPTIGLNASSTREHFSENGLFPPHFAGVDSGAFGGGTFTQNSATVDLAWDIDFWGRNRAAIDSAKSQVRMAEADQQAARLALSTSIARSWFQLQRLGALREVTDQAIRQRSDVATLAQQRFDAGLDTNAELRQAEALLPEARVELAQIDESIGLVKNQIAALLGQGPDRGRSIGTPHGVASAVVAVPAALPAELVGRRPDIVAARWRVEAAQGQIKEARAEFYPNVNLAASIGLVAFGTSNFLKGSSRQWSAGPALSLPIFEGGRLRANLAGRDADYDSAVEQYNQTVVDAVKDVADQVVSLQSVNAQLADQELARVKTEQAYDVAVVRYKAGLTTYLTVLNAQTSVLQQERADAELKSRILDLNVALMRALGGGYRAASDADSNAAPIAIR
jgi:NodT family efflux transporter outer membrane factor (OMF) lipoprotein